MSGKLISGQLGHWIDKFFCNRQVLAWPKWDFRSPFWTPLQRPHFKTCSFSGRGGGGGSAKGKNSVFPSGSGSTLVNGSSWFMLSFSLTFCFFFGGSSREEEGLNSELTSTNLTAPSLVSTESLFPCTLEVTGAAGLLCFTLWTRHDILDGLDSLQSPHGSHSFRVSSL